jgi:hypothetical protein
LQSWIVGQDCWTLVVFSRKVKGNGLPPRVVWTQRQYDEHDRPDAAMYADGHFSTFEDEALKKLLVGMGFNDEIDSSVNLMKQ